MMYRPLYIAYRVAEMLISLVSRFINAALFDGDGSPVDITNATVRFHVRNAEGAFRARLLASPERNTVKFAGITKVVINALGEGAINVCGEGGDVQPGNLIVTSSTPARA